jgi:hypothetical protein
MSSSGYYANVEKFFKGIALKAKWKPQPAYLQDVWPRRQWISITIIFTLSVTNAKRYSSKMELKGI